MKLTRERYIPEDARLHIQDDQSSAIIYRYQRGENAIGIGFCEKRQKPSYHYRFQSEERRERYEQEFLSAVRSEHTRKKQYLAAKNKPHTLKVGDILYTSWGYDQTNIDFYLITEIVNKSLYLQKIGAAAVESTSWASDIVVADPNQFIGLPIVKRADGFNHVKLDSHRTASLYDGQPLHRSWYA